MIVIGHVRLCRAVRFVDGFASSGEGWVDGVRVSYIRQASVGYVGGEVERRSGEVGVTIVNGSVRHLDFP